ncbi:MAG TPA: methyltransferase domain-containing protein [Actinocrinis sp.]|uniref:class I SAM-dependent methyltransferase n=1 Tax=Actinocrinis sp. TaxID=1920516 RepID=UPI002DDD350E|nr:methyltransferase domain-containing protein [Actinocrinis sp.]HEV2348129.1 methyltransferase domain-containing protein [Actinocrinis sp.]
MTTDSPSSSNVYATGGTRERIENGLAEAGLNLDELTADQLSPIEHFHVSGPLATMALIDPLNIKAEDRVLDAGTGIGGTARYVANKFGAHVTAVDLTAEYVAAAQWLNELVGLDELIDVSEADVTDLPFEDGSFDLVVSQHVQMNIADKAKLYAETARVLAPGGRLAIWDVVAGSVEPLLFPVPWANNPEESHLAGVDELREILEAAGFEVDVWNDQTKSNAEFMRALLAAPPSPLGLHLFVPNVTEKIVSVVESLEQDRARLIQAVLVKR